MTRPGFILRLLLMLFLSSLPLSLLAGASKFFLKATRNPLTEARLSARFDRLPVVFEANRGQTDRQVKFLARGLGYSLFLTQNELVISMENSSGGSRDARGGREIRDGVLRVKFLGAKAGGSVIGTGRLPAIANYFIGNDPNQWRVRIPTYSGVRYAGIYPGVDLVVQGTGHNLEYDFVIAPGALAQAPRMQVQGAQQIRLDSDGNLSLRVDRQQIRFLRPQASQQSIRAGREQRRPVAVRYRLLANNEVGFQLGTFDHHKPLLIDPVLDYSTYLGGNGGDVANGIVVGPNGNAYVVGTTASSDFPTLNPHQKALSGGEDAFVTKFAPNGESLVYSTFLGGTGDDIGNAIAIDSSGNAYITGSTSSADFPIPSSASTVFQSTYGGNEDAFVSKLDPTGATLIYSSYLGGSAADYGNAIAVDSAGHAYVAGATSSINFPVAGPYQAGNDGASDGFVTEFNPAGSGIVYSTYLGGSAADSVQGIAVDSSGDAYVTGYTYSTNFPTANPIFATNQGSADAFASELNPAGSSLVFSTYLGGSGLDHAFGIALDASNNIYIAGDTESADLPVSGGTFQSAYKGNGDAFVAKLSAGGSSLAYLTYLGGTNTDRATSIAVGTGGNAFVTGYTLSDDFPTLQPLQPNQGGGSCGASVCADAFVAELNAQGTATVYSTYLGGSGTDSGQAIALGPSGNAYVAGSTSSANFPAIAAAFQGAHSGTSSNTNAFVAEVDAANLPGLALTPQRLNFGNEGLNVTSAAQSVTVINAGSAPLTILSVTPPAGEPFGETDNCVGATIQSGGTCTINVTFTPTVAEVSSDEISIVDNASGSPHGIDVTGTGVSTLATVSFSPSSLTFLGQAVGTTSAAKSFTVTNTGTGVLSITPTTTGGDFTASGDFAETDNCGFSLNQGASCTVFVTFTPTSTGNLTGSLTLTDNASGSPQKVSLTGAGVAEYTLAASANSSTVLVGTASTTFTVRASGPTGFTESIALACTGSATCSFNPASINVGQTSTVTVTGLSASTQNPFNFTVTGTSSSTSQTTSVPLTIFLSDFAMSGSPPLDTVKAGNPATYTVTVTPINGFNQTVQLSCNGGAPQDASCSFSPSSLLLGGSGSLTSTLTLTTTAYTAAPPAWGKRPLFPGGSKVGLLALIAWMLLVGFIAWKLKRSSPHSVVLGGGSVSFAAAILLATVVTATLLASCGGSNTTTSTSTGSQPGNYTIHIQGVLGSNSGVTRTTTVNLAVD